MPARLFSFLHDNSGRANKVSFRRFASMIRKWSLFAFSAVLVLTFIAGISFVAAHDDDEGPLGKIMEKVQKHKTIVMKGTRTKVAYSKAQKDVEKSAKELAKLAKEAKPLKDALKKAKDEADPQGKWNLLMDEFEKTSVKLGEVAGKASAPYAEARAAYDLVNKTCVDCHKVFRVED
jgi:cytochrome c556